MMGILHRSPFSNIRPVVSPFVSRLCIRFYGYERPAGPIEILVLVLTLKQMIVIVLWKKN